jgi:hypothetical protein
MDIASVFAWLAAFFDDYFLAILVGTGTFFLAMLLTWSIYRTLSRRNIFFLTKRADRPRITAWDHTIYILKYFFLFPLYTFIGFVIFAFLLFMLIKPNPEMQRTIIYIAIVIVSTIRVSAYVDEGLAEEIAKIIPISMLAFIFTHPNLESFAVSIENIAGFILLIPQFLKYLLFTVVLEALLRGGTFLLSHMDKDDPEEKASSK